MTGRLLPLLIAGLALAACRAPNAPGSGRELVLTPSHDLALDLARIIAHEQRVSGTPLSVAALAPLVGRPPAEVLLALSWADGVGTSGGTSDGASASTSARAARDTRALLLARDTRALLMARLPDLEDLVEGVLSELVGTRVDLPSPGLDLTQADLRVVSRDGGQRLHQRDVDAPWLTPCLAWACAHLLVLVGPDHWDDLDPDDLVVQRAAELAAVVALDDDPLERARATAALRLLEDELSDELGLSESELIAHDAAHDARLSPVVGLSTRGPFIATIDLRLDNGNWTTRSLIHTWAHELTHHVFRERLGWFDTQVRSVFPEAFRDMLEENLCEVLADLTVQRLVTQRLDLPGETQDWLDLPLIQNVPRLDDQAQRRLDALLRSSRRVDLGDIGSFERNAANEDLGRTYRSLKAQLHTLAAAWGADMVVDLACDIETREQLDALVALAEAGEGAPDEVPDGASPM